MNPGSKILRKPKQNRVTPFGQFDAVEVRGTFLGNRGRLHNEAGEIGSRTFAHRSWICCLLEFKGRHRVVFSPTSYSELFALDEAVFMAAGHRPCGECRRAAFDSFKEAWRLAHGLAHLPRAAELDMALHAARLDHHGRQRTHTVQLGRLPDGVMIETPGSVGGAALVWRGQLHPWSHAGYGTPFDLDPESQVVVLTPQPTVAVLAAGYSPAVALGRSQAGVSPRGACSVPARCGCRSVRSWRGATS